jgi:hypothetical protein
METSDSISASISNLSNARPENDIEFTFRFVPDLRDIKVRFDLTSLLSIGDLCRDYSNEFVDNSENILKLTYFDPISLEDKDINSDESAISICRKLSECGYDPPDFLIRCCLCTQE